MNGGEVKKELTNPSIQTVLLLANLVAIISGVGVVWGVQTTRIESVTTALAAETARVEAIEKRGVDHYQVLISQIATLQTDIKYLSQGIAELKLRK